ncbi:MAG: cupin domain-containing protein [Elusimicrobia bacterium]|nr:cupin domain-containing protein [Elusimicrobiota bacterium]
MREINAEDLIRLYKLEKHPEGGYFRESYRAEGKIEAPGSCG